MPGGLRRAPINDDDDTIASSLLSRINTCYKMAMPIIEALKGNRACQLILLVALVGLTGCVKTTATRSPQGTSAGSQDVQVFYTAPTDREFTEIGLVTTQTGQTIFHDRSAEGMINKLKLEAGKMGADAIIVRSANEGTWGLKGGGNTGFERGNAQAVAIQFK